MADRANGSPGGGVTIEIGWRTGLAVLLLVVVAAGAVLLWPRVANRPGGTGGSGALQATVGQRRITSRDVDVAFEIQKALQEAAGRQLQADPSVVQAVKRDMLDQLVDNALLLDAAAAAGVTASAAELEPELAKLVADQKVDLATVQKALATAGVTDTEWRGWALDQLVVNRYMATPEAAEKGRAYQRARGVPDTALGTYVPQPADVASVLQEGADIRFYLHGERQGVPSVRAGQPAPDFTVAGLDGQPVSLSSLKGRPVMVNFWATWCQPCKIEMPIYAAVYDKNKAQGLEILAVNVQEEAPGVQSYQAANKLPFPIGLDTDGAVATVYRVRGLPTTVFIDANGIVTLVHRGAVRTKEELLPDLQRILPSAQTLRLGPAAPAAW
jgi:thiol-disulfide isomerase/thioredoxin